jgi:hypothetical protein
MGGGGYSVIESFYVIVQYVYVSTVSIDYKSNRYKDKVKDYGYGHDKF